MECDSLPRPRSRRLQALARRSSRLATPRGPCSLLGVSFRLIRRLSRAPCVPWKAFRTDGLCLPPLSKAVHHVCGSASLTQRKQQQQPRRRVQRLKAKERPVAALQSTAAAGISPSPGAASSVSAPSAARRPGEARAPADSGKRLSFKRGAGGFPASEAFLEGSVVSLSPSSSCCAASVSSEANTYRTCGSSSNNGLASRRPDRARDGGRQSRFALSEGGSRGPSGDRYPAVHACRPRIFFITLSSVKRQAKLKLSFAGRGPSCRRVYPKHSFHEPLDPHAS